MTKRLSTTCLLGVAACSGSPPPAPATTPIVSSEPAAAAASAAPTSAAATPTQAAARASPFHVIGELPSEARLFGAGERGFVASQSGIVFSLVGDDVVHDPLLQRGFGNDWLYSVEGIAGTWPDSAWLSTAHPSGRSGFTRLWQWDGKRWASKQSTPEGRFIAGIRPWLGGRQLAIEQAGMMFDAKFRIVSGDKNVTLPAFSQRKNVQSFCRTELRMEAFETLPNGDVFVAGPRCTDDEVVGLAVGHWAPGSKQGTLETLPGTSAMNGESNLTVTGMAVRSVSDVLVSAEKIVWQKEPKPHERSTYLAHFDGSRWRELTSPVPGVITSLTTSADGTLFATNDRGTLFTGKSASELTPVTLPKELASLEPGLEVVSLWLRSAEDVWAIAATPGKSSVAHRYLLHTRPATGALPTVEQFEQKERAFRLPGPPVEWCRTPFVLLYTLGKKAPADYDYPSTREALKGHREFAVDGVEFVEFERVGAGPATRFFGARVPDFTLGEKLAALVKDKVPGSTPELVCHDPLVHRRLAIDLATGAVKK